MEPGGGQVAPQAQLEESANDRTSRRCPLVGMLREFRRLFYDHVLRVTSTVFRVLGVQKRILAAAEIGQIVCACVSVCTTFLQWVLGTHECSFNSCFREKT